MGRLHEGPVNHGGFHFNSFRITHEGLFAHVKDKVASDDRLAWLRDKDEEEVALYVEFFLLAEQNGFDVTWPVMLVKMEHLAIQVGVDAIDQRPKMGVLTPSELYIRTPDDVSRIVQLAMTRAGLGPGQIAMKTKINRGQVYNLAKQDGALPREPDQLLACLKACKMPEEQIDLVVLQWRLLRERRRRGKTLELTYSAPPYLIESETSVKQAILHSVKDGNTEAVDQLAPAQTRQPELSISEKKWPFTVAVRWTMVCSVLILVAGGFLFSISSTQDPNGFLIFALPSVALGGLGLSSLLETRKQLKEMRKVVGLSASKDEHEVAAQSENEEDRPRLAS
ncbi:hypothetical protein [Amycolatopsis japonica]